jgi:hypothetical protein
VRGFRANAFGAGAGTLLVARRGHGMTLRKLSRLNGATATLALVCIPIAAGAEPVQVCARSTPSIQQLALIDGEGDGQFQCLAVSVPDDKVMALRVETHSFTTASGKPVTEHVKLMEFPRAVVESDRGAVLDGIPGHDAIVLRGHFSTPPDRTEFVISYLYNGFTGEYHSCQIALGWASDTGWRLVNRFDQTISHIVVRTRRIPMAGPFGIANLEGACTSRDR